MREDLKMRGAAALGALALCTGALAACASDDEWAATIAATTGVTAEIAESVAEPDVEVVQIVPDGASPHDYELSAKDRQALEEVDLVVANGSGLEAGIPLEDLDTPVWELTAHAGELRPSEEGEEEAIDPHVWMDPTRVARALPSLARALSQFDPAQADTYRRRASEQVQRLRELDRELDRTLDEVPRRNRELVTSHDSLAYLADRYEFEVLATAFPATGAEAEASAGRLAELERMVRAREVPAVFAQEGDDPEALRLVAEQTGAEANFGLLVESPSAAGSYEEMLRRDAELIADSLR